MTTGRPAGAAQQPQVVVKPRHETIDAERRIRVETYIWRDDGWGLTALRVFPRGREPLAVELHA